MNGEEFDPWVYRESVKNLGIGNVYSYFLMLLGIAFLIAGILKNRRVPLDAMTLRDIIKSKWQLIVATVVGLSGALLGGISGGLGLQIFTQERAGS